MKTLIRGGTIVTASDTFAGDIFVDGEQIIEVGAVSRANAEKAERTLDATGQLVLPGAIDPHVHMELPFMGSCSRDDFEAGTIAAVAGGTTTIIDFAIPTKQQTLQQAFDGWQAKAEGNVVCDYALHMSITKWSDEIGREIPAMVAAGLTSFKMFTAYKGVLGISDDEMLRALFAVRDAGGLPTIHAVNGDALVVLAERFIAAGKTGPRYHVLSQPSIMEGEATNRVLLLAAVAEVPIYIVHMTCVESLEALARARQLGVRAMGETCTQYLLLDASLCDPEPEGSKWILSPPLRGARDREALWAALDTGLVETIGTDHCPFDFRGQKDLGKDDFRKIPNGFGGVEERLSLLYSEGVEKGRISLERWVDLCSTRPAKVFGLYPRKGALRPGADADIVLFDPAARWTCSAEGQASRCDYNTYEGLSVKGRPATVLVRGEVVHEGGNFEGRKGMGRFVARQPFAWS